MTRSVLGHALELVSSPLQSGTSITFSYLRNTMPGYYPDAGIQKLEYDGIYYDFDLNGLSVASKNVVEFSLFFGLSSFTNLVFSEVSENGNLQFGQLLNGPSGILGWAYTGSQPHRGDFWLTPSGIGDSTISLLPVTGIPYGFETIAHETGHSLGLNHTHPGSVGSEERLGWSAQENTSQFSIMSYNANREGTRPIDYQLYDIAALQSLYGRHELNVGSTTYRVFHEHLPIAGIRRLGGSIAGSFDRMFSIWDGGGADTIDGSDYATSAYIDLRPGHFSSIGSQAFSASSTSSLINDDWTVHYDDGGLGTENISIAFGAYIANNDIIGIAADRVFNMDAERPDDASELLVHANILFLE